ncbi:MAG: carbohydrate ABC transporter substrate-binding protein [Treponema sp.]|nr:carbohydrate ABC transporter substrate-binding protein [Treponema sp.]
MTKKIVIGACLMALAASSMFAAKDKGGKVLNIYVWNDEFPSRFNDFYASKNPKLLEGVKVNFIQTPNQDNAYQNKLDEALMNQANAKDDEKVDIFCVEADYALKYVDTAYTLDVMKDVGLKKKDVANQYQYTKDIMTDSKGKLKGVSWQSTPGGFVYRRSYAKQVLGTDDPVKVQAMLSDWDKFDAVAAKMKAAGYFMLSGYDDAFRAFADNMKSPWVKGNKIVIDPQITKWIEQTKTYTEKGYNNKASLWSAESTQGMMKNGKVFGYFAVGWFFDFCMPHGDGSAEGDWAICEGPQGFSWGGTWICGAAGSDNVDIIKDVMMTLTCDTNTLKSICVDAGDCINSAAAMKELSADGYKSAFLGNQNPLEIFLKNGAKISKSNMSKYDQGMTETIMNSMKDYYDGKVDLDTAWDNFYTTILEKYPNLKK